jgi:hypothetical protein
VNEPLRVVLDALEAASCRPRGGGGERSWVARCPVSGHGQGRGDRNPSLSVVVGDDGRVLVHCHAGCPTEIVVSAIGLTLRDLFPREDAPHRRHRSYRRTVRLAPRPDAEPTGENLDAVAAQYRATLTTAQVAKLAESLGISETSLHALELGWDDARSTWSFPMRDGAGTLVGFRLRTASGSKFTRKGTHAGLFIPASQQLSGRLFVAEGPTDTAALLDLGFPAIGRPSCSGGSHAIVQLARRLEVRDVVLVADADAAGRRGAEDLARELLRYAVVRIIEPPQGDLRGWYSAGGATPSSIQQLIDAAALWKLRVVRSPRVPEVSL